MEKLKSRVWSLLAAPILLSIVTTARADLREFRAVPVDAALTSVLQKTAEATAKDFPKLTADNIALSLIDLTKPEAPIRADYHGDAAFYPASVIKLFFMVDIFRLGQRSPEIDRALREMIHVSDNDAAAYLVDVASYTTAGPELEGKALQEFIEHRRAINRYFDSLGYEISAMMKPWSFAPYGREVQLLGANKENRNRASTNSVASLLYWIVRRRAISAEASDTMMSLLERPLDPPRLDENQIKDFLGESLPPGTKLWSKAGDTGEVRHDAAYAELPGGRKLIIVIFTRAGDEKSLVPSIGRHLLEELSR